MKNTLARVMFWLSKKLQEWGMGLASVEKKIQQAAGDDLSRLGYQYGYCRPLDEEFREMMRSMPAGRQVESIDLEVWKRGG